jgi:hypothetical protein
MVFWVLSAKYYVSLHETTDIPDSLLGIGQISFGASGWRSSDFLVHNQRIHLHTIVYGLAYSIKNKEERCLIR